jgi:hypothetical protein
LYKCGFNTWSRTRKSARRLEVRIDVSFDESTKVITDDVSCLSLKSVRGAGLSPSPGLYIKSG